MIKPNLPQRWPKPPTISYYAVAALSVAVGIIAAELITRFFHAEAIASSMLCAVIFAAWFGGLGPALLAIALALLAFHYYLVPPINSFTWKHDLFAVGISEVPRLVLFSITSLFVAFMISAQGKATEILRRSRDDLQVAIEDHKRIEAALRRSEAYLAEAQHLSHTSSWAWDVRRREWAYRSAEVYHLFGFDPEKGAVPLQAFRNRILPEDRRRNVEAASQAIREKADFEVDFRVGLPDGSIKRIHSVGHPVVGSDGDVIELIGTHIDVTEQHLAKEALQKAFDEIKKSEDRLRLVIDTIPTLVWRAGPEGNPDFLNQPALDYTGISLDQAATGWPRAFHPDDKKGMLVKWSAIRESGMRGGLEARLRRLDGEYRWFLFQAVPLRDESGNIVKWYGSSTDIEDRKRTEVALRESEQRFRDYAETASDWLWETGPDHGVTHLSEHTSAAAVAASALIGLPRWQVATDVAAEPEKWRQHQATLDAHLPFRDLVYRTFNRTGSQIYVRTSGKPFFDAGGNFLGYRGVSTDITATIRADQAEQALRKARAELAHVTRVTTLGELTASISHEVNQPLAAIVANAEACLGWLDRETPDLAAARQALAAIAM